MTRRRARQPPARFARIAAGGCALFAPLLEAAMAAPAAGPPMHRALIALIALPGGFALCLIGWEWISRRRRWRGAALVAGGLLLGVGATSLLRLNAVPQTWGWWI